MPLTVAKAPIWPIVRGRSLASLPGGAGTVVAVSAVIGLLPLPLALGWLGQVAGLTPVLLVGHTLPVLAMLAVTSAPRPTLADR